MPIFKIKDFSNIEAGQFIQPCACSDFVIEIVSQFDQQQGNFYKSPNISKRIYYL